MDGWIDGWVDYCVGGSRLAVGSLSPPPPLPLFLIVCTSLFLFFWFNEGCVIADGEML